MRKLWSALLGATLALSMIGGAHGAAAPPATGDDDGPSAGGLSSDNVEWIRHIPLVTDGVGGRLVGKYFYVTDQNKLLIFDVSTPEDPQQVGMLVGAETVQQVNLHREDVDTNGKILLFPNTAGRNILHIVDVEDKTNPRIISSIPNAASHTVSCILDCTWAYGDSGNIIDLRDPTKPELRTEKWGEGQPSQGGHDVTEVAPGLVLTSSNPIILLDARKDPVHPKLLATSPFVETPGVVHSNEWPRNGKDKFFMIATESLAQQQCNENTGIFSTWSTENWKKTHSFKMVDTFAEKNGTYVDGHPAAHPSLGGCSIHWFNHNPKWKNGGLVTSSWYGHGTRILNVDQKGQIEEVGWWFPWTPPSASASYWITDEIIYVVDYHRGLDVIRFTK